MIVYNATAAKVCAFAAVFFSGIATKNLSINAYAPALQGTSLYPLVSVVGTTR